MTGNHPSPYYRQMSCILYSRNVSIPTHLVKHQVHSLLRIIIDSYARTNHLLIQSHSNYLTFRSPGGMFASTTRFYDPKSWLTTQSLITLSPSMASDPIHRRILVSGVDSDIRRYRQYGVHSSSLMPEHATLAFTSLQSISSYRMKCDSFNPSFAASFIGVADWPFVLNHAAWLSPGLTPCAIIVLHAYDLS